MKKNSVSTLLIMRLAVNVPYFAMFLWAAERGRTSKAKAWTYYFSRAVPWPEQPQYGAFHTSEAPYVFGNFKLLMRSSERNKCNPINST